jgi:crotonobetainyl-CoA:carnitine CoA-transferase CaiB-like acyl-CoA transferase
MQARSKRSVALDLRRPDAQGVVRGLAAEADVLVENYRPGALEGFGLAPEALMAANPRLIVLRISGYGQTGAYRDRPGFGVVGEAMGGLLGLGACRQVLTGCDRMAPSTARFLARLGLATRGLYAVAEAAGPVGPFAQADAPALEVFEA